jgi:hypothetical protein
MPASGASSNISICVAESFRRSIGTLFEKENSFWATERSYTPLIPLSVGPNLQGDFEHHAGTIASSLQ